MGQIRALAVSSIERATVSEDASGLTLVTAVSGGQQVAVTFAYELLPLLVALAAMGSTACKRQRGVDPNDDVDVLPASHFELAIERKSGKALLAFTLQNGGKLTFPLSDPAPATLHRLLGDILEGDVTKRVPGSYIS